MSRQDVASLSGSAWDDAVSHMIGPRTVGDILNTEAPNPRRLAALDLAAAALRAAGQHDLAAEALKRKW